MWKCRSTFRIDGGGGGCDMCEQMVIIWWNLEKSWNWTIKQIDIISIELRKYIHKRSQLKCLRLIGPFVQSEHSHGDIFYEYYTNSVFYAFGFPHSVLFMSIFCVLSIYSRLCVCSSLDGRACITNSINLVHLMLLWQTLFMCPKKIRTHQIFVNQPREKQWKYACFNLNIEIKPTHTAHSTYTHILHDIPSTLITSFTLYFKQCPTYTQIYTLSDWECRLWKWKLPRAIKHLGKILTHTFFFSSSSRLIFSVYFSSNPFAQSVMYIRTWSTFGWQNVRKPRRSKKMASHRTFVACRTMPSCLPYASFRFEHFRLLLFLRSTFLRSHYCCEEESHYLSHFEIIAAYGLV